MHINLNQLRAFYLAAREKSITKAAEALHVTQTAVTMQIKSFEKNLDIQLFRKYSKELLLTDAGTALFGYTERIFLIVGELEHALKSWGDLIRESLTIGTTRSFARLLMPELLSRFQERFPTVRVALKGGSSQEIADGLMAFQYDLGIIGRLPGLSKLKAGNLIHCSLMAGLINYDLKGTSFGFFRNVASALASVLTTKVTAS